MLHQGHRLTILGKDWTISFRPIVVVVVVVFVEEGTRSVRERGMTLLKRERQNTIINMLQVWPQGLCKMYKKRGEGVQDTVPTQKHDRSTDREEKEGPSGE